MRYKCIVSYDGTLFHGFQTQKIGLRTVQTELEDVLLIITKKKTKIYGAGRTDSMVHAYGQVFHFDSDIIMKDENMRNAINSRLPRDIYITKVEKVLDTFHSRFSAKSKTYEYRIDLGKYDPLKNNYCWFYKYYLDLDKMIDASKVLIGEHDFKSFTKNNTLENTIRTIHDIKFTIDQTKVNILFKGNGFMHNMVRIIVAMLVEVGKGRITKEDLIEILNAKNRKLCPKTAPANGLYLMEVEY